MGRSAETLLVVAAVSMLGLSRSVEALVFRGLGNEVLHQVTRGLGLQSVRNYRRKEGQQQLMVLDSMASEVVETVPTLSSQRSKLLRPPPKFEPTPYTYLQEITVRIESLTNLGEGIARDGETGWVIMVAQVIPGELVKCKVFRNHKSFSEATLTEVIEPSPERTEPRCPLFGLCGGCQYQHMDVRVQREWKRQQVVDVLTRIGGLTEPEVKETFGTEDTYGYRSKLTPHYEAPFQGEVKAIGFQRVKFPTLYKGVDLGDMSPHKVVDVEHCHIATDGINEALPAARKQAISRVQDVYNSDKTARVGRRGSTLLFRETEEGTVTDPNADVSERVKGLLFKFRAGEFFQNNPRVLPHMVDYVVKRASEGGTKYLIDAYCGGGLFCLSASSSFEQCAGIEISSAAVECATENASLNGIGNCLFLAGTASNIFENVSFKPEETVIIVDPPRKGCDNLFLEQLFKFRPQRLVYVSCDPATQARDAKEIIAHDYTIVDIQPFDLFPQTRHIENVITFQDNNSGTSV